jgi:FKBP-type peptidyl-prolyl cis-trans isomerase SlyD
MGMRNPLDVINSDKVVGIHYTLRDKTGRVLETSADRGPMFYLPGRPKLAPGMDRALMGHHAGDFVSGVLEPKDGYGTVEHPSERILSREKIPDDVALEVGMRIALEEPDGNQRSAWIRELHDDKFIVDTNHPFSGKRLQFDAFVLSVRDATAEERQRGVVSR